MLYRLIKETGEIDYYTMKKLWAHLKYFYPLTPKFRASVCEQLEMGGVLETALYKVSNIKEQLGKKI